LLSPVAAAAFASPAVSGGQSVTPSTMAGPASPSFRARATKAAFARPLARLSVLGAAVHARDLLDGAFKVAVVC
jgi:hypothetical protein